MSMSSYREIPFGHDACTVCDEVVPHLAERRLRTRPSLRKHGKRGDWCPGSHKQGKPWIEGTRLPKWDDLSDLDKGCALLFVWKIHWERSYRYAKDNYPATYRDNADLVALPRDVACRHAHAVASGDRDRYHPYYISGYDAVRERIGDDEFDRLYNLALNHERQTV